MVAEEKIFCRMIMVKLKPRRVLQWAAFAILALFVIKIKTKRQKGEFGENKLVMVFRFYGIPHAMNVSLAQLAFCTRYV